jgi:competence protein ComEC
MLYRFYTITPLASIWTLLVLPLMGAILTLGFVKIILFFLLPTLSAALGVVVTGLSDVFIRAVKLFAALDFTEVMIGHVPVWLVVLYCAFVPFAFFVHFRRPSVKKAVCAVMAVMLAAFIGGVKWQRTHRGDLILTCLDVSHGQAIMVEFPGGGNAMFDAGSLHKSDIGRRIVGPFLDYGGISSIDAVFVSHNDIDHVNGIPEVVEWCKVGRVYANGAFFEDAGQWGAAKFLGDFLSGAGLEIEPVTQGLDVGGRAHVKSIWPSAQLPGAEQLSDNDRSQVFLIEFASKRILLCSDIEKFAQREIIRQNPDLRADVVVAPHHGSTNTADPDFLKAVEAKILIISCGQTEYQRQHKSGPQEDAMQRLFTSADGAVTVRISEKGKIQIETAAGRN